MYKEYLSNKIADLALSGGGKVLELGSGKSQWVAGAVMKHPNLYYCGIEPNKKDYELAQQNIGHLPNVELVNDLAYDFDREGYFDVVYSLSVLEHVKNLDAFLKMSVSSAKKGGYVIHSYDLGHALTPSSIKERSQVFLSSHLPSVVPESKFVTYLDQGKVTKMMERYGVDIYNVTYHRMPGIKKLFKHVNPLDKLAREMMEKIIEWEFDISSLVKDLPTEVREDVFQAVCVWGRKT